MTAKYTLPQRLAYVTDGPFTWSKEDPRRWNHFRLGLHAEISVRVVLKYRRFEKDFKMAGDKNRNAIWARLLSLMALITTYNNQLVVTPNEMVGLYCGD